MLVVVGGHSRNIGKTSLAASLIRSIPEGRWTAVKITQHSHGICSEQGGPCPCAQDSLHPYALDQEREPGPSDSGRFLAAGAERSFWLRTARGQLGHGMPALRELLVSSHNVILESNSILQFLRPDLYIVVLDFRVTDMKESTRRFLDRADVLAVVDGEAAPPWDIPGRWIESKPRFAVGPPDYCSNDLVELVRARLHADRRLCERP